MRWVMVKLWSTVNERSGWVLGWASVFLKGIRTLGIRWEGVGIAQMVRLSEGAISGLGDKITEVQ